MVTAFIMTQAESWDGRSAGNTVRFSCSLELELPSGTSTIDGDKAYTSDTGKRWNRISGAWVLQTTDSLASSLQDASGNIYPISTLADGAVLRRSGGNVVGLTLGTLATQNGTFSGTSSGTNTGDQTSVSGNAGTATALATPRTINGTSFDGTANITVAAAAGTLTGTTLAANVVTSSLTSVGTLTSGAIGAGFTVALDSATITGTLANARTTATSANTANSIVSRDASGNFTAGTITASLTGTASGNLVSGGALGTPSSGNLSNCTFPTLNQNTTGSAATLTTARNINGVAFNGSADVTVTAAAGTLTGATLASGVTASSLTSFGASAAFTTSGAITSSGTSGVGYAAGAGGTVTQATSKSTGVTLNKTCGEITMNGAALAAATIVSFTLTNSTIAAADTLILNHVTTGTRGAYGLNAQCSAGSAIIYVRNNSAGSLSEAIVLRFGLVKGATA